MRRLAKILIVVAVVLGLVVVMAQDPATVHLESSVQVSDARFVQYASAVTASPVTSGDSYEMLVNGDQAYPAMLV